MTEYTESARNVENTTSDQQPSPNLELGDIQQADELKAEGNDHFRAKSWDEALAQYRSALGHLPKRKVIKPISPPPDDPEAKVDSGKGKQRETDEVEEPEPLASECAKARAVLNANIGACYVKLGDHKAAVSACTEALSDDPVYIKALQRRAASSEQLNTWSSLASAQEDYTKLLELLPPSQTAEVKRSLQQLKPRVAEAQKRETDEMVDKLKGLGNSILGNFGLSTNNFKFEPNGQGGYSMNFVQ
ncbi:unnamed protein product [Somion occarium]|uniref:Tetratricopeptide repeat protein 1 n=1 Tax=Somion occarium TaxID=3059160 RepID=A0ABP1CI64_9APHY